MSNNNIKTVKVTPDGDVTLLCGDVKKGDRMGIVVSSAILTLGSPVFKAMLSPRFKEGANLAKAASTEIPLPEDDPSALLTLCKLLHLHDMLDEPQTPAQILKLAFLADKYNCCGALRAFYSIWVRKAFEGTGTVDEYVQLFVASYLMKLPSLFKELGHKLIFTSGKTISLIAAGKNVGILDDVTAALNRQRESVVLVVANALEKLIKQEFGPRAPTRSTHECHHSCTYLVDRSNAFGKWLFASAAWPISTIMGRPLQKVVESLDDLASAWLASASFCAGRSGKACCGKLLADAQTSVGELQAVLDKVRSVRMGPCFECVGAGHVPFFGSCKKGH